MIKYKIEVLFLFILSLCTFSFASAQNTKLELLNKVIYIDPGHGGMDPGTTYKDIEEATINLIIGKKLANQLEGHGAIVYLTRYNNNDLSEINAANKKRSDLNNRAKIINDSNCNLYISIHLNSEISPTWNGAQTFYTNVNKENEKIAKIIQNRIQKSTHTSRKAKSISGTYLYERIKRPGILFEAGFLSNPSDRTNLQKDEYQQEIALILTEAVIEYLTNNK